MAGDAPPSALGVSNVHRIADSVRSLVGYLTPAGTKSQFATHGTLTPAEFVAAGEFLVARFPAWRWQRAARSSVPWLPPEKQFLALFGAPCRCRVGDLAAAASVVDGAADVAAADGWNMPELPAHLMDAAPELPAAGKGPALTLAGTPARDALSSPSDSAQAAGKRQNGTPPTSISLAAGEAPGKRCSTKKAVTAQGTTSQSALPQFAPLTSRTYDLFVTYDKYYRCPRVWLRGFSPAGAPLEAEEIFEDVMSDYMSKTVTIDPMPLTGELCVSIHPCRHAAMMRAAAERWRRNGQPVRADLAVVVLLKLIASVVPTVQFDVTTDLW